MIAGRFLCGVFLLLFFLIGRFFNRTVARQLVDLQSVARRTVFNLSVFNRGFARQSVFIPGFERRSGFTRGFEVDPAPGSEFR